MIFSTKTIKVNKSQNKSQFICSRFDIIEYLIEKKMLIVIKENNEIGKEIKCTVCIIRKRSIG